jgi:hypothetical protein
MRSCGDDILGSAFYTDQSNYCYIAEMTTPSTSGTPSSASVDKALLEKEYFHLQSVIESFDAKSLTIKAWSVSIVGAVASSGAFFGKWQLLLFASVVSLMFWLIDAAWKTFQYANYRRIGQIEEYMRGKRSKVDNLQIARSWHTSYKNGGIKRFRRIMLWGHVFLPHGAMCVGLFLAYIAYIATVYAI